MVFSDELHYLIKGNKLIKCAVEQINNYRIKVLQFVPQDQ